MLCWSCFAYYSNTSHVPVYRIWQTGAGWFRIFKYISCSCLSQDLCSWHIRYCNSNTSHVPVYQTMLSTISCYLEFKYISCSCLSSESWKMSCWICHSNTSHVPVYQFEREKARLLEEFKYISCSCLSNVFTPLYISIIRKIPLFYKILFIFYQAFLFYCSSMCLTAQTPLIYYIIRSFHYIYGW